MKHLLTAIACFFALSMSAQFPYNPDSDSDNLIGAVDLLSLLPLYGSEFNIPTPEVYQGSSVNTYIQYCQGSDTCFIYPFTTDIYLESGSWNNPMMLHLPWENSGWCHALNIRCSYGQGFNWAEKHYKINLFYSEFWEENEWYNDDYGIENYSTVQFAINQWDVHQFTPSPYCDQLYKVGN